MTNKAGIFSRLDTVILRVRDLEKSKIWYEEKLGLTASYFDEKEKLVIFDLGGTTSFTIWQLKQNEKLPPSDSAGTFPIFLSDDANATYQLLKSRNVAVKSVEESGGVRFFGFFDPDGNHLEVCQILNS